MKLSNNSNLTSIYSFFSVKPATLKVKNLKSEDRMDGLYIFVRDSS
jgi:hypothetical protein